MPISLSIFLLQQNKKITTLKNLYGTDKFKAVMKTLYIGETSRVFKNE